MFSVNNSMNLLIGKSISRTASVQISDSSNSTTFPADGEILVLDETGAVMTAGNTFADSKYIQLVQRSGAAANPLIFSARIRGNTVTAYKGRSYQAPQEQIHYIGYNGSSGAIDGDETTVYKLRLQFKHNKDMWSEQIQSRYYEFVPSVATVAADVAQSFAQQVSDDADVTELKIERVTDGTFTVLGGASTLAVTQGSKTATASAAGHALVVGDYVRIGGAGATFPVYKVAAVSGTTITLDQKYQGATATVANANVGEMSVITSWGIKLTGKALDFTVGKFKYTKVMFDILLQNWGTTTVTKSQDTLLGSGTYEQIAELEWFAQGFDKAPDRVGDSSSALRADAVSSTNYDLISIVYFDASEAYNTISGATPSPQELKIALVDGAAQATNILAVLNPWMNSVPGAFNAVVL